MCRQRGGYNHDHLGSATWSPPSCHSAWWSWDLAFSPRQRQVLSQRRDPLFQNSETRPEILPTLASVLDVRCAPWPLWARRQGALRDKGMASLVCASVACVGV